MGQIGAILSLALDGDPPVELGLPKLTTCAASVRAVREGLRPFASSGAVVLDVNSDAEGGLRPVGEGLVVIYLVGHAWIAPGTEAFCVAYRGADGQSVTALGSALVETLNQFLGPTADVLVIVDTCHAAAMSGSLAALRGRSVTAVYASDAEENAWSLRPDGVTRFAFEFAQAVGRRHRVWPGRPPEVRILDVAHRLAESIDADRLTGHQHVDYDVIRGRNLVLTRVSASEVKLRRSRTRRVIVWSLLAVGIVVASAAFLLRDYWHGNALVTVDLGDAGGIISAGNIAVYELRPDDNQQAPICTIKAGPEERVVRKVLPATNLLIVYDATYADGRRREIRFHRKLAPAWFAQKFISLALPPADQIQGHPDMAYVAGTQWLSGRDARPAAAIPPYWIDIAPPTVRQYMPFLLRAISDGDLETIESMIASDLLRRSNVPDDQLQDNGQVVEVLKRTPPRDSLAGNPECPAPMTLEEAQLYARKCGKRLPTPAEWELAVRGVDGRQFPWGNKIDPSRVNAGLPGVGWENRSRLRPATGFPAESPFGLIDTVGNAGDWVELNGEPAFMGGCFNQNEEDCTAYAGSGIPSSHLDTLAATQMWLITYRGVDGPKSTAASSP